VDREEERFCRVVQPDGYAGWVDRRFLNQISESGYREHIDNINAMVTAPTGRIFDPDTHQPVSPYILYYGTKLRVEPADTGFARILLADSCARLIKTRHIRPINSDNDGIVTGTRVVAEAQRFLGVPYLWGGVTVTGFDCSGLVRTILSRFGIYLPRDTKDQISVGKQVERDCIKTGDLVFFDRHVGFALGQAQIVHASRGGGGVRVESLRPELPHYREDLDRGFVLARRVTA
jgi:hypothetical protein